MAPRSPRSEAPDRLLQSALAAAAGASVVLDQALRVRLVSVDAERLLATRVNVGVPAANVLCARSPDRKLLQAMIDGVAAEAAIPHPGPGKRTRMLKVRAEPLRVDGRLVGWLLLLDELGEDTGAPELFHGMWSRVPAMKEVFRTVERVARDDATVLVRGDTGTGKELVARAIHAESRRASGPFQALNCAALPANLLESELFGHVRGAFTGAHRDSPGHVQRAHRGTLILDEVAELPLELQAKLLRVVETRTVIPVGGREPIAVDVRIVSATHRSLRKEVEAGRFRADLMYRLRVIPIFLPSLRERRDDVALLVERLVADMNGTSRRQIDRVTPAALARLERHDWPGNVRELSNVLAYAFAMGDGPVLSPSDLPRELRGDGPADDEPAVQAAEHDPERARIADALARARGSKHDAAHLLGISRVTLWRRMRALGMLGKES